MTAWGIATTPMMDFLNDLALIANENILLFSSYFVLLFTHYVPSAKNQKYFGVMYLVFLGLATVFNVVMLIVLVMNDVK